MLIHCRQHLPGIPLKIDFPGVVTAGTIDILVENPLQVFFEFKLIAVPYMEILGTAPGVVQPIGSDFNRSGQVGILAFPIPAHRFRQDSIIEGQ